MRTVVIGSTNPVKTAAAKAAFASVFPHEEFNYVGVSAPSGVSDQPMGDAETLKGARSRVHNAREMHTDADFYFGMEGGCELVDSELTCFAWIVVLSRDGLEGKAKTGTFFLPHAVKTLVVDQGMELGHANDVVFHKQNSKQSSGAVGLLTNDVITRTTYYQHAAILALIPLVNVELYKPQ